MEAAPGLWALHGSAGELCHLLPWQPPPQYSFIIALASLKGLPTALGPTHGAALSRTVILMFTGNSDLPHALL